MDFLRHTQGVLYNGKTNADRVNYTRRSQRHHLASSRPGQPATDHRLGDDDPIEFVGLNLARSDGRFLR